MSIGTSLGNYYDDELHKAVSQAARKTPDDAKKVDPGIIMPESTTTGMFSLDFDDNETTRGELGNRALVQPVASVGNIGNSPDEIMQGLEGTRQLPSGFSQPERIKKAALQMNGELFENENHGMALTDYQTKYPGQDIPKNWKDGFTTTHGRFVSREEAFDIAKKQDQIDPNVLPSLTADSTMLLSEDLK